MVNILVFSATSRLVDVVVQTGELSLISVTLKVNVPVPYKNTNNVEIVVWYTIMTIIRQTYTTVMVRHSRY